MIIIIVKKIVWVFVREMMQHARSKVHFVHLSFFSFSSLCLLSAHHPYCFIKSSHSPVYSWTYLKYVVAYLVLSPSKSIIIACFACHTHLLYQIFYSIRLMTQFYERERGEKKLVNKDFFYMLFLLLGVDSFSFAFLSFIRPSAHHLYVEEWYFALAIIIYVCIYIYFLLLFWCMRAVISC